MSIIATSRVAGTPPGTASTASPAGGRRRSRRAVALLLQTGAVVLVLAGWWAAHAAGLLSNSVLPSPLATGHYLAAEVARGRFWLAIGQTLSGAAQGLAAALVVGIPLGLLTGTYRAAERSARLVTDVGRAFPIFAILPVLLLVIGATMTMKAVCVFLACLFPVWLQAQYGAMSLDPTIRETVRAYRIPGLLRFRKVVLPAAMPSIMTGVRLGSTTAVLVCVGVELLTSVPGMGARIVSLQTADNSAGTYAYIIACGLVGFAITRLAELAEDAVLRWRPPAEED